MINENAARHFFKTLAVELQEMEDVPAELMETVQEASEKTTPDSFARAQTALANLTGETRDKVFSNLHAKLRLDGAALMQFMPSERWHGPKH